jgi:release factor glutamine methyltransferase
MDVRGALKEAIRRLREARVPSPALAAELLLMHVAGRDRAWLYAHPEAALDSALDEKYFALVEQRAAGTPTQYLTGKQEFWGLELHVEPGVLIPRPETEHVVEVALERLARSGTYRTLRNGAGERILDVGTGSGCLALALAKEFPAAEVIATDISAQALRVARGNAERLGFAPRIRFVQCDLLECFAGGARDDVLSLAAPQLPGPPPFDLLVSNPPYVSRRDAPELPREVLEHEPDAAIFGGEAGAELYAPLVRGAVTSLRSGGILVMELGYDSLPRVRPLLDAWGAWTHIQVTQDLAGIPRVISALRA